MFILHWVVISAFVIDNTITISQYADHSTIGQPLLARSSIKTSLKRKNYRTKVTTTVGLESDTDVVYHEEFDEGDWPNDWKVKRSNDRRREIDAENKEIISANSDSVESVDKESMLDEIEQDEVKFADIKFPPLRKIIAVEEDSDGDAKSPHPTARELPAIGVVENDELSYN